MNPGSMAYDVTVALVGDRDAPPPGAVSDADFRIPWEEREKVELTVNEDESLAAVLTRAASELRCPPFEPLYAGGDLVDPFFFVAWHEEEERVPLEERMDFELTLVDHHGEALWAVTDKRYVPYRQIVDSAAAGVLDGDPFKLYLIRRIPQAGGVPIEWGLLVHALEAAWQVADVLADAYGAYEVVRRVRDRLAGREAFARQLPKWAQRQGRPEHLRRRLSGKPWDPRGLATVLGCTEGEAEQILSVFGYTPGLDDQRWQYAAGDPVHGQPATDEVARLLAGYLHEVTWRFADRDADDDSLKEIFTESLARLRTDAGSGLA
jgi:hypothetical protein